MSNRFRLISQLNFFKKQQQQQQQRLTEITPEIEELRRRFLESGRLHTLHFERADASHITARAAFIALAERRQLSLRSLSSLVASYHCDIRRVLNDVQLYVSTMSVSHAIAIGKIVFLFRMWLRS